MLFLRGLLFKKIFVEKTLPPAQSLNGKGGRCPPAGPHMKRAKTAADTLSDIALRRSAVYKEFLAEREEILKHKWLESEKALLDWIMNHRDKWRNSYRRGAPPAGR